jgi:hypothetical protein
MTKTLPIVRTALLPFHEAEVIPAFAETLRSTLAMLRSADLSADQYLEYLNNLKSELALAQNDGERIACCLSLMYDLATIHGED